MSRVCATCSTDKPLGEFHKNGPHRRRSCKACKNRTRRANYGPKNSAARRALRVANKDRYNGYTRKSRGMPQPTRPCPELCEVCGKPPARKSLHLDHDHVTGKFRGWLCFNCNTAIGKLGDSSTGVGLAFHYLLRAEK